MLFITLLLFYYFITIQYPVIKHHKSSLQKREHSCSVKDAQSCSLNNLNNVTLLMIINDVT